MKVWVWRTLIAGCLSLGVTAAVAAWAGWFYAVKPLVMSTARVQFALESGWMGERLRVALAEQGIPVPGWAWGWGWRMRRDSERIRAGVYDLQAPLTLAQLMDQFTRGAGSLHSVVLIEGWTFSQVRAALAQHPALRHETNTWPDAVFMQRLGAEASHPEGWFAPDTYAFAPGSSDWDVLQWAYRLQQQRLQRAWADRPSVAADGLLQSPYELLILASIIEKETGVAADRPKVAAVFLNRLRRGMPLQSDPTTIYGLGAGFDGDLRRRDLQADTPYNTYVRLGLTPTPIAMPGVAAMHAALQPAVTDALYFVARGDGTSEFSADLAAHNRAVARYQKRGL